MMFKIFFLLCLSTSHVAKATSPFHELTAKTLNGKELPFKSFKDQILLVVNIASQCGYTPQLKNLQTLQEKYKNQGFEVLAFPSDDFHQEPLTGQKIEEFCKFNYGVSFKIFEKSKIKGPQKNAIYSFLSQDSGQKEVQWNFEKFLINKKGHVYKHYSSSVKPLNKNLIHDIEALLAPTNDNEHHHDHPH
ncbi:MAG: glutathione peroxidase [Oligoflexales bacterium]